MNKSSTKGIPRPHTRGPRPQRWVTGPDPELHRRYRHFQQQRNQANFRGEPWDITFEQWCELWGDLWHSRGRERGSMCMTRRDWYGGWTLDNVVVITREEHARQQRDHQVRGFRSGYRSRWLQQQEQDQ